MSIKFTIMNGMNKGLQDLWWRWAPIFANFTDNNPHSDSLGNSKTARNFLLNLIRVSVVDLHMWLT